MLDTIQSYLVSLGFKVDQGSLGKATESIDSLDKTIGKFATGAVAKFSTASLAVSAFILGAVGGIAAFLSQMAKSDLEMEKLSRQMWLTKDDATAFNYTLKAMGASLQDLYLSPELMRNFQLLRQESQSLRAPKEYEQQMKFIRSIQFEFTRMKLEVSYASQWVAYYLVKYLEGPLTKIKTGLMSINDVIIKEMPHWTKEIAKVMSWFVRMAETGVHAGTDLIDLFKKLSDKIPESLKIIGGALVALGLIIKTGPIGILTFALAGLLILLDDFYTYMQGGDSQLGVIWEKLPAFIDKISNGVSTALKDLKDFWNELKNSEAADKIKEIAEATASSLKTIYGGVKKEVIDIFNELKEKGEFKDLKKNLGDLGLAILDLKLAFAKMFDETLKIDGVQGAFSILGKIIKEVVVQAVDLLNTSLEAVVLTLQTITALMNFDIGGLNKAGGKVKDNIKGNIPGFMGGGSNNGGGFMQNMSNNFANMMNKVMGMGNTNAPGVPGYQPPAGLYPDPFNNYKREPAKINLTNTNNIYGSDPQATADAATDNAHRMWTRNLKGAEGW